MGYIHERGAASGLGASMMLSVVQHTRMDGLKWIIDITDKNNYIRLLNNSYINAPGIPLFLRCLFNA